MKFLNSLFYCVIVNKPLPVCEGPQWVLFLFAILTMFFYHRGMYDEKGKGNWV